MRARGLGETKEADNKDIFRLLILGAVVSIGSGCAGGFGLVRVMEPPIVKLDMAEISANLPEGKAMIASYDFESLQPESMTLTRNDATLTPGSMMDLIKFGGGLGADPKYRAIEAAVNKDRKVNVTLAIAESSDIRAMRISDNQARLVQQGRIVDVANRIVITQDVPVVITPPIVVPPVDPVDPTPEPTTWRRGLETIKAVDNSVTFQTRNIQLPSKPNDDGGSEYIIARIMGEGYGRILLMTMDTDNGRRSGSRIFVEGPGAGMYDGKFSVPLSGPSAWRVWADGGQIRIELDGKEIFSTPGGSVREVVMTGYPKRGFLGEWAQ